MRRGGDEPYVTDNGGYILDCHFGATIADPVALEAAVRGIAGVVEVGLFTGMADAVVIGSTDGVELLLKPGGRLGR